MSDSEKFVELYWKYKKKNEYKYVNITKVSQAVLNDNPAIKISLKSAKNLIAEGKLPKNDKEKRMIKYDKDALLDFAVDPSNYDKDFEVPKSFYEESEVFTIPNSVSKLLVIGDLHIPFHHIEGIKLAVRYAKENGCDGILLNGDMMDFHFASRFLRDPRYRNAVKEIEVGKVFLESLRKYFTDEKIYYKIGNHDQRLELRLIDTMPELHDLDELKLTNLLGLHDLGIDTIAPLAITEFGKLNILHGHEFHRYGIHVAYNNLLKSMDNIMFCHYHKTQEYIHTVLKGDVLGSWSVGCLCGLRPEYLPLNNWNLGFAIVSRRGHNGSFEVSNKKIISGRIL